MFARVTSHFPAATNSIALVSSERGSSGEIGDPAFHNLLGFYLAISAIIIATSDWLYTFLEVRRHSRPFHLGSASAS